MNLLTNMMMLAVNKTMFNNIKNFASEMSSQITTIAWTIFMLAIVIAGVCWVVGGQTAQFAKSTLGRTIIGIALVALAAAIVSTIASLFGKSAGKLTIDPAFTSYVLNNLAMLIH
ncbi:TrbC/VirB2 family protein [Lactobacillus delbrueckii]|uniref:TrbC/VirB2 family protein n=1 Tax=Lactobacillus delbrueckii TaxID=1584 RepID=A0AAW5YVV1_9LACO|nr:TrbC/VirB2 family protein [Lactobacillus delbrueckii]MDA3768175.1 TrbC/VirB2 family protein [Lactobacillus delbrueckii]